MPGAGSCSVEFSYRERKPPLPYPRVLHSSFCPSWAQAQSVLKARSCAQMAECVCSLGLLRQIATDLVTQELTLSRVEEGSLRSAPLG